MATPTPDDGLLWKFGAYLVSGVTATIVALLSFLFKRVVAKHDEEVAKIEEGITEVKDKFNRLELKLSTEFVPQISYETNRRERRLAEDAIHEKIAATADDLHKKIEAEGREARQRHDQVMAELLRRRGSKRGEDD